ncbi:uncharacterized protein [Nicotiana sylvestris]|uniref:uncharacterized protein n=1 Tax=Nicotiana sylvestris TaxID=4096 RepID=UPI00388C832A
MTFVRQIMSDLERLQRDLSYRPVARPNDVPRALGAFEEHPTVDSSAGFPIYHHYQGTTSQTPQAPPPKPVPYPPPPITHIFVASPFAKLQQSSSEPMFQAQDNQYYPPEPTFKASEVYTPRFDLPAEAEKPSKNPEQEEMFRKVKSLEQSFRYIRGLGGQVSVAYKDLCLFPNVQLPVGFKMPKFDLYDGHGDSVAHLRGFCSKMRGAKGKDELLMAYFSQNRLYLTKLEKKHSESFREYSFRWREQAARVDPPMKESKMVDYFLQALEPTYYGHLVSAIGKSFNKVVKMGGMVEEGLKSNKIMSYSAIKATTQAIQGGTRGIGKNKREDVAMVDSGTWFGPIGSSHHYNQPRPHHQSYPHSLYNPPQHYYRPPEPHFSVHHAQTYNQPPTHAQWRAPIPQNTYPPPRAYRNPPGPSFRPNQAFKDERLQKKKTFTPLGESYTSLFHRLRQLDMLRPIQSKLPNPPPKNLDYSVSCEYCSGTPGHDTKKCWHLKSSIQELIDTNRIEVQALEAPNINRNLMPTHQETNMIEIMHKGGEPRKPSQTIMMIWSSEVKPIEPSMEVKKRFSSDVAEKQERVKVVVPGVATRPIVIVEGARTDHVIIKPGLTRSGRCFAPEELRKAKDNPVLVKKVVTEEEAEEFLRKMKMQDYSIVEQLKKTSAQISILTLLIHSNEHRRALMKILNEAHVPDKILVNHLEKIANKIFEVNRVTFSEEELPVEGTEHNRALYLTVKCEDSVVTRVLVDNGSSANIYPLSTLSKLKVEDERIHKNSICVQGFDGGGKDSVGDIVLERTIGPVEFTMKFQVLDIVVSYNLLLGRPWIHAAKAVPSTLHQMVKFEWYRQEIVVHGKDNLCAHSNVVVSFIEMEDDKGSWVYQVFDTMLVEKVPEGKHIPNPKITAASVRVAFEMLKNGFVPGKGLG